MSTNQDKRDRREWAIMTLFAENYTRFPIGDIVKSERPDFLLRANNKLIGIELTELKYERRDTEFNLRAHEDYLSSIMLRAQQLFEQRSKLTLVVDVHFKDEVSQAIRTDSTLQQNNAHLIAEGLSESIANIVADNLPEATGKHYIVDRNYKYGDINLPSIIDSLHITNVTGRLTDPLWYASISTRVKPLSVDSINQRIDDKSQKLPNYQRCDQNWLIIIQNSFLMSSHYDPIAANRALKHKYRTIFNRVFVFERSQASVTELSLIHPLHK